jgi:hypothetical protein
MWNLMARLQGTYYIHSESMTCRYFSNLRGRPMTCRKSSRASQRNRPRLQRSNINMVCIPSASTSTAAAAVAKNESPEENYQCGNPLDPEIRRDHDQISELGDVSPHPTTPHPAYARDGGCVPWEACQKAARPAYHLRSRRLFHTHLR